jgi:phosphopantothenoylcysteine decarboxylase / phosphopantothenate---cysteine ligase
MGIAITKTFAEAGFEVFLVAGHLQVPIPEHQNIKTYHATSADEMHQICKKLFPTVNCAILTAAVADYTPVHPAKKKIKSKEKSLTIELKPTSDIAAELGKIKKPQQLLVGFALETDNEISNARKKLKKKNLDFIVLNSLRDEGAGFQTDTNKITIIGHHNNIEKYELKMKEDVAMDIAQKIINKLK